MFNGFEWRSLSLIEFRDDFLSRLANTFAYQSVVSKLREEDVKGTSSLNFNLELYRL